ncbi:MAG: FAD-dependent thymidylate synthase [Flavonifractor sp.]|jgi:thymidylate synthase (FAD)|nr:FAD-dependent thymidylate synthase [Flavonifractor sp.]MCI9474441.1 FAD-dependent thymidylate synthase [Flavonifractor sp.]
MKIIPPSHTFLSEPDGTALLQRLERTGRICYKSEGKITETSYAPFLRSLLQRGHESVIEHACLSVLIVCDRGVSHEIVRHRIASYSQESTRYCNYAQEKFGRELTFIRPCFWQEEPEKYQIWQETMAEIERNYFRLLDLGAAPQEARSILPNSLKTELAVTMNLREWRHFFRLRTDAASHPQMRETACALLEDFRARVPILFDTL